MFSRLVLFGKPILLYTFFNNLATICMIVWMLFHLKEYSNYCTLSQIPGAVIKEKTNNKFLKFSSKWFFILIEAVVVFLIVFLVNDPVTKKISLTFLGDRSDNYFGNILFVPYVVILLGSLLFVSPLKLVDLVAPMTSLALIFYKIACFCCGCCNGVESEKYGLYNHYTDRKEIPIQLVELACAVIMFIIILIIRRKKDRTPGTLYPIYMLMYCGSRFISEFWRDDYPNTFGPLKGYHIQCIIGFVEGLILLFIVLKFGNRITEFYASKKKAVLGHFDKSLRTEKTEKEASDCNEKE